VSRIAFLGLGQMGTPMARRLIDSGRRVVVWNRTPERAKPLTEIGATLASSPRDAVAGVDLVITMLATPDAVEDVLYGSEGFAPGLTERQTVIEMSTIGPKAFTSLASRMPDGVSFIDAPVRGSISEAAQGRLVVLVGADDEAFERVRPVLDIFGDVRRMGPVGSGAAMKLVINSVLGASIVALGEALALGRSLGLAQAALLDALEESPIGSMARSKRASVESGRYPPRFKARLAAKDMRLALEAADEGGVDVKEAKAVRAWLDEAVARGTGDLDYSAVIATILGADAGS
jgi:3-hydroxyisobutyrate dehydrogenase